MILGVYSITGSITTNDPSNGIINHCLFASGMNLLSIVSIDRKIEK